MLEDPSEIKTDVMSDNVPIIRIIDTDIPDVASDTVAEALEVGLDQLVKGGILREFPLLSSAVSVIKIYVYTRDWLLQRNLSRFLYHLRGIPENEKQRFISKLREDNKYIQRVGENLLLLLHRADDIRKPKLMARILRALIEERIGDLTYQKLSTAVDRIRFYNIPGLVDFYSDSPDRELPDDETLQDLVICGLANIVSLVGLVIGDGSTKNVSKNKLGELFIEIALERNT